jgi:hypothetical protein
MIETIVTAVFMALSFFAGKMMSDRYHAKFEADRRDALQRQFVRLQARADADDPCQPYQLPAEFENRLKENGRATFFRRSGT